MRKNDKNNVINFLYLAIIGFIVFAVGQGIIQALALDVFTISLTIWAWNEVHRNDIGQFRRVVGWAALASLFVLLFIVMNGMLSGRS